MSSKQKFDYDAYVNIQKLGIHNITCRPTIFPYYDIVKWVIG